MARKWTKQQRAEQNSKAKARAAAKRFAAEGNTARALPPMSKKELELSVRAIPSKDELLAALELLYENHLITGVQAWEAVRIMQRAS